MIVSNRGYYESLESTFFNFVLFIEVDGAPLVPV